MQAKFRWFLKLIACLTFFVVFYHGLILLIEGTQQSVDEAYELGRQAEIKPQSIGETQQILKDKGYYKGKVDYKWGTDTETAYCNWCSDQAWDRMAEKE